jgi:hypothetical protein
VQECEDVQEREDVREREDVWEHKDMQEHKDARWNVKMRENAKMRNGMQRCVRMQRCATMQTKHKCGKVSWVHDGDVALWSPLVMSRKIGLYQPVENWVSTSLLSLLLSMLYSLQI